MAWSVVDAVLPGLLLSPERPAQRDGGSGYQARVL